MCQGRALKLLRQETTWYRHASSPQQGSPQQKFLLSPYAEDTSLSAPEPVVFPGTCQDALVFIHAHACPSAYHALKGPQKSPCCTSELIQQMRCMLHNEQLQKYMYAPQRQRACSTKTNVLVSHTLGAAATQGRYISKQSRAY